MIPPHEKDSSSGVWYFKDGAAAEVLPIGAAEFERLYILRPETLTDDVKQFAVHEYLVRFWQSDMTVPRFENLRLALVERRSGCGVEWELCLKNQGVSICGIHFTGAG